MMQYIQQKLFNTWIILWFCLVYFLENIGYKRFIYLLDWSEYNDFDLKAAIYNNINNFTNDHNNKCCEVTTTRKIIK